MRAEADEDPPESHACEGESERVGCGDESTTVEGMERRMSCRVGEGGQNRYGAGVVEGENSDARWPCGPPGEMRTGTAEPAIPVVQNDEGSQGGCQAETLRKMGVTSASMAS